MKSSFSAPEYWFQTKIKEGTIPYFFIDNEAAGIVLLVIFFTGVRFEQCH